MKTILALFVGALFGFAAADFWEASKGVEAPMPRPAVVERTMAQEISKPEDKTCYYTQAKGETYTIALPAGVECITVLGATK